MKVVSCKTFWTPLVYTAVNYLFLLNTQQHNLFRTWRDLQRRPRLQLLQQRLSGPWAILGFGPVRPSSILQAFFQLTHWLPVANVPYVIKHKMEFILPLMRNCLVRLSQELTLWPGIHATYNQTAIWNSLPLTVRDSSLSLTQFCARPKTEMFCRAYDRS